ncbi:MAG: cytochrome b/b6 domain-containing protein [Desulfobulbaceae bacterium]|nr:cytochrome b/b6 domain-containing protein [Desulfobulbaceae bacterium]
METTGKQYVRRFGIFPRVIHFLVIVSFLTLAVTGMALKFAAQPWAEQVAGLAGSFTVLGVLHRLCAVLTFIYFCLNFVLLFRNWQRSGKSLPGFMFDADSSLIPMANDGKELLQTYKWFFGLGPQPRYGRWTYWEKFDYMAVFWGVAVIGTTGLCLWFPEEFTTVIPGYWINIATIIHSDEALLASGFIFTIHFFNTHLRPEKFPMDPVIFTGVMPLDELKHERPREYEALVAQGKLEEVLCDPPPRWLFISAHLFGLTALAVGVSLVVSIIYTMVFVYGAH